MYFKRKITSFKKLFLIAALSSIWLTSWAQDKATKEETQVQANAANATANPETVAKGKTLFANNCAQCHAASDELVIGPGLKGITKRRTEAWLLPWIKSSTKVIQSGDKYGVELYNKYNKAVMPNFDFADDEIKAILYYIESEAETKVATAQVSGTNPTAGGEGSNAQSGYFTLILGVLIAVLVLILVVLLLIVSLLHKYLNQKTNLEEADQEILHQSFDIAAIFKSKAFLIVAGVLFFLVVAKAGIDAVSGVGIQQGYAPTQPIPFSHKLHAGNYQINCNYCHTGVYKGKSAGIPSPNICMNCHNAIKRESPEIQKIYSAIEKNKPIEWVRIHNLPDFAYFNHSQHTQVAGLECANCHGEIEKMEVVQQRSPLTMGWCIDCHRKTAVNAKDNAYYDKLLAVHKKSGKGEMKVENIGGLECSKCHY